MRGYLGCETNTGISSTTFIRCDSCEYEFDSKTCAGFRERTNRLIGFRIHG